MGFFFFFFKLLPSACEVVHILAAGAAVQVSCYSTEPRGARVWKKCRHTGPKISCSRHLSPPLCESHLCHIKVRLPLFPFSFPSFFFFLLPEAPKMFTTHEQCGGFQDALSLSLSLSLSRSLTLSLSLSLGCDLYIFHHTGVHTHTHTHTRTHISSHRHFMFVELKHTNTTGFLLFCTSYIHAMLSLVFPPHLCLHRLQKKNPPKNKNLFLSPYIHTDDPQQQRARYMTSESHHIPSEHGVARHIISRCITSHQIKTELMCRSVGHTMIIVPSRLCLQSEVRCHILRGGLSIQQKVCFFSRDDVQKKVPVSCKIKKKKKQQTHKHSSWSLAVPEQIAWQSAAGRL